MKLFILYFQSRTIRQFDSSFTAKLFGYDSYQEYYNDANIHLKLHQVKIPVLALNAADDPFSPKRGKIRVGNEA